MKVRILIWILALLAVRHLAVAEEDLRLQNGTVYHVIDVRGSDYGHILIEILDGRLDRQVWVPLSLLTPEQITSLKDLEKKSDDQQKLAEEVRSVEEKVKNNACLLSGQIVAFEDNGVIAQASLLEVTEYSPSGFVLHSRLGPAQAVYISGSVGKNAVSGDTFETLTVYPIGIFEQSGQRYRAYTTDIDLAAKYWIKNQRSQDPESN